MVGLSCLLASHIEFLAVNGLRYFVTQLVALRIHLVFLLRKYGSPFPLLLRQPLLLLRLLLQPACLPLLFNHLVQLQAVRRRGQLALHGGLWRV